MASLEPDMGYRIAKRATSRINEIMLATRRNESDRSGAIEVRYGATCGDGCFRSLTAHFRCCFGFSCGKVLRRKELDHDLVEIPGELERRLVTVRHG